MAAHTFVAGERPSAANWQSYVGDRVIADVTSTTRPTAATSRNIVESDTKDFMIYDGSAWVRWGTYGTMTAYTPSWTCATTAPAIGNGSLTGAYRRLSSKLVVVYAQMTAGSTTTFGTGAMSLGLPSGVTSTYNATFEGLIYPFPGYEVKGFLNATTTIALYAPVGTGDTRIQALTGTSPYTFANGTSIFMGPCFVVET